MLEVGVGTTMRKRFDAASAGARDRWRLKRMRGACLAVLALLGAIPCRAGSALEPPDPSLYQKWGPLWARPGAELRNTGYDSNILLSSRDPIGDYTASLYGSVEGLMSLSSKAFLTFDERLGYTAYVNNPDQNFPTQLGTARVTVPIERFGVFGDLVVNQTRERPVDRLDIRPIRSEDALGIGAILEPGSRTELQLSCRATRWRYHDPDLTTLQGQTIDERLDRDVLQTAFRGSYEWSSRTSLTLDAGVETMDFLFPAPPPVKGEEPIVKDATQGSLIPGITLSEGDALEGSVRLGWIGIRATDPRWQDLSSFVGDAKLTFRPERGTTLRLDFRRMPDLTVSGESAYYMDTRIELGAMYHLNRIVEFELAGLAGRLTFPANLGVTEREDNFRQGLLATRFNLAPDSVYREVSYRLKVQRFNRWSNVAARLTETIVGFDVVVEY